MSFSRTIRNPKMIFVKTVICNSHHSSDNVRLRLHNGYLALTSAYDKIMGAYPDPLAQAGIFRFQRLKAIL